MQKHIDMIHCKKYSLPVTLLLVLFSITGCDDLLQEKPKAQIVLSDLNPTLLEQTIIGAYEPWTRSRGRLWESTVGIGLEVMAEYGDGGSTQINWSNYTNINLTPNSLAQP